MFSENHDQILELLSRNVINCKNSLPKTQELSKISENKEVSPEITARKSEIQDSSEFDDPNICGIVDTHKGQCGDTNAFTTYMCYPSAEKGAHDHNPTCGAYDPNSDCQKRFGNSYVCKGMPNDSASKPEIQDSS